MFKKGQISVTNAVFRMPLTSTSAVKLEGAIAMVLENRRVIIVRALRQTSACVTWNIIMTKKGNS
jgi:hypothetical protein